MKKKEIELEFLRILNLMVSNGDLDAISDLITFDRKKDVVNHCSKED